VYHAATQKDQAAVHPEQPTREQEELGHERRKQHSRDVALGQNKLSLSQVTHMTTQAQDEAKDAP
jgi:hypothetical protein